MDAGILRGMITGRGVLGHAASRGNECRAEAPGGPCARALGPPLPRVLANCSKSASSLETLGNVWGIVTPPQDWSSAAGTNATLAQFAAAAAPAPEPPPTTLKLDEPPVNVEHRMAEVATFPSPSPAAPKPQAPKLVEAPNHNAS